MTQRVVLVSATNEIGGADTSLFELVRGLDRTRFDVHVVLPHDGGFAERYRALSVPVHVVPIHKLKATVDPRWQLAWLCRAPLRILRLWRLFARLRPDVVHVNSSVDVLAGLAARLHAIRKRCRLVWHVRELRCGPEFVGRAVRGMVRRLADTVVAISTPIAGRFAKDQRVYVIPNGVDVARFRAACPANADATADASAPTLGWVGRIAPNKGLDRVLDAFALVRERLPTARLVVMGAPVRGHERFGERLRQRAEREFRAALLWLPEGPDPERAYARMQVFVHLPDVDEGLGRTAIEAQASGVPVVAWPRGGLGETFLDGVTGRAAPIGDVAAAAAACVELLADPQRRLEMGRAARRRAAAVFSRERCARAVEQVYEELLR